MVTGPTGAIGVALCRRLLGAGMTVYAVVRPDSARAKVLPKCERLHVVSCDLDEITALGRKIRAPVDAFFHLAWVGTIGEGRNDVELTG